MGAAEVGAAGATAFRCPATAEGHPLMAVAHACMVLSVGNPDPVGRIDRHH